MMDELWELCDWDIEPGGDVEKKFMILEDFIKTIKSNQELMGAKGRGCSGVLRIIR